MLERCWLCNWELPIELTRTDFTIQRYEGIFKDIWQVQETKASTFDHRSYCFTPWAWTSNSNVDDDDKRHAICSHWLCECEHWRYSTHWHHCVCSTWLNHDHSNIVVDQTAQLGVSASVSTLAIHDIASVIRVEEHDPSVSHIQLHFLALINDKQIPNFQSVLAGSATSDQVTLSTQPAGVTVSIQLGPIIIADILLLIRLPNPESPLWFPLRRLTTLLAQKKVAMHCPYCNTWNIRG